MNIKKFIEKKYIETISIAILVVLPFAVVLACIINIAALSYECHQNEFTESPLKLTNEMRDNYNNILQQTFYNEVTDEFIITEYTYVLQDKKWVCIDQQTTIISNDTNKPTEDKTLKIYYNKDLAAGPITIMDNEYAKVSIVKYLAADNWWEFGYEIKVENKTSQVITIMIDDAAIMDINCKPLFSIDHIDAKNTAYFTLAWQEEELKRCYIPYVDNIEFMVRIYDNEDWTKPALVGEKLLIKQ